MELPTGSEAIAPLKRVADRWLRAHEVPRLNGQVHLVTQTTHLRDGLVDVEAWAFDSDGSIHHRREYGHRSAPLVMERRITFGSNGLPRFLVARRRLDASGHEIRDGAWRIRVEPSGVLEVGGAKRRKFAYYPLLDQLEHRVHEGALRDAVLAWMFCAGGGMEHAVIHRGSLGWHLVGAWDNQNIQVWGVYPTAWRLEVVKRDSNCNPVTAYRRYAAPAGGDVEAGIRIDTVTWEVSYAQRGSWPA